MAAEAIGAFLAGFTDQYLEIKRDQRQAEQFQQTLQIHEMALKLQQLRHDQDLALNQRQQANLEAHQREQERVDRFQALTGAQNVQSQIQTRQAGTGFKEQELQYRALMGKLSNQLKPEYGNLQKRITGLRMAGMDTTQEEARLRAIDQTLGEANRFMQQPMASDQQQGQRPPMLTGDDEEAEGQQPQGEETEEGEPEPEGPPIPEDGGGGGGMAQQTPARAPAAPGGHAPAGPQPIAQQGGQGIQPPVPVRMVDTDNDAAAAGLNKLYDSIGVYNIRARSKGQKSEEERKIEEDQVKSWAAESITALDHKDEIDNALARHGVNARMTGHGKQSVHLGGHLSMRIGGFLGQNASGGISDSVTETQAPKVGFDFGEERSGLAGDIATMADISGIGNIVGGERALRGDPFVQPDVADRIATTLVEMDQQYKSVSQPIIVGAQGVIADGRDEIFRLVGKQAKTIERGSFDAILDAKKHRAAQISESLPPAEAKLAAITKGPLPPVGGYPNVVDKKESLDETIDRFGKALNKFGSVGLGPLAGLSVPINPKAEASMLFELKRRLQPDRPDGTYSKAAQEAAKKIIDGPLQSRAISPQMRSEATRMLSDIAVNKAKPEAATEGMLNGYNPPRGGGGVPTQYAALAGLAMGQGGKEYAGKPDRPILPQTLEERRKMEQRENQPYVSVKYPEGKPPQRTLERGRKETMSKGYGAPAGLVGLGVRAGIIGSMAAREDVTASNAAIKKVKEAKQADRVQAAKDAVDVFERRRKNMTDKEKEDLKGIWSSTRTTWQNWNIPETILKRIDDIVNGK